MLHKAMHSTAMLKQCYLKQNNAEPRRAKQAKHIASGIVVVPRRCLISGHPTAVSHDVRCRVIALSVSRQQFPDTPKPVDGTWLSFALLAVDLRTRHNPRCPCFVLIWFVSQIAFRRSGCRSQKRTLFASSVHGWLARR